MTGIEPYSNQDNSYVFPAAGTLAGQTVSFNIFNSQHPIKTTRSVEDTWSITAIYSIIYARADGYSDLKEIMKLVQSNSASFSHSLDTLQTQRLNSSAH